MSFESDLNAFSAKLKRRANDVFVNTASAVKSSITDGSAITAAPGQPVDTSNLKNSWQLEFESPTSALISTNVEYAEIIESNVRGATLRSGVGGFHSIKLTVAGFPRLVEDEARKLAGAG